MKYAIFTTLLFLGQLLSAQALTMPEESFRFYKAKPKTAIQRTYKLSLRELVAPSPKAPILLVKPVTKQPQNAWESKKQYPRKVKSYQKNSLTLHYDLSKKTLPAEKHTIVESNLVQAFVPTHSVSLAQKAKAHLAKASVNPGVNIQNIDLIKVKMPKKNQNTIYPNPTQGVFNVELAEEATEIKVVNLVGGVVLFRKVTGKSFYGLDISHLPKGTYIASFLQKGKWLSQRIVLVK